MCLHSITSPTQSRFISLSYKDRFLQSYACGHCAECLKVKSLQWSQRCDAEFSDLPDDGYVMFDCLSYREKDVPHLSDFWTFIDRKYEDFYCFNRLHIRKFWNLLRTRLERLGFNPNDFRHYYACEYGTKAGCTHRPHIHIMIYVHDSRMSPSELSMLISDVWKYGRTDGFPYKPSLYVLSHNVVRPQYKSSRCRTIAYITKYLQKCCEFQYVLNKRVSKVMHRMAEYVNPNNPDEWLESELARRERLKLLRMVNQFHRSSQYFGDSALSDMDYNELVKFGCTFMDSSLSVKVAVPLSTYYKRKLFYEMVNIDGARYWQLNDLGREYYADRHDRQIEDLASRFRAKAAQANIDIDAVELSKYVLDDRGRIKADIPSVDIQQRLDSLDYYNYMTSSDKLQFNQRGLSHIDYGSSQLGYKSNRIKYRLSHSDFIKKYVILDDEKEKLLYELEFYQEPFKQGKQDVFELKQHLSNVYKMIFV